MENLSFRNDNNQKSVNAIVFGSALRKTLFVKTLLTRSPEEAAALIREGGIVAFPTETVYGLGADAFDTVAIRKIFDAKMRPADNPLIAHVSSHEQITQLSDEIPDHARKLIDAFFPGPLTIVLRKTATVPEIATAGLSTIGIRMPRHAVARKFLHECGRPIVAPSANLSSRPSPTTWQAVVEDLDGRIDCILQAEETEIGLESTVVDCTSPIPTILRKGAVTFERLRKVIPEIRDHDAAEGDAPRSPGMKHRHYSPSATVIIVRTGESVNPGGADAFIGLNNPNESMATVLICETVEAYAHALFEYFRDCDRRGVKRIFCEAVPEKGIGAALMDRIRRATAS